MAERVLAAGDAAGTRLFLDALASNDRGILSVLPLGINIA